VRTSRLSLSGCLPTRLGRNPDSVRIPTNQYDTLHLGRANRPGSISVPDLPRRRASPSLWTPQYPDKIYEYHYQDPDNTASTIQDPPREIQCPWIWTPPDLAEGSAFYLERLQNLRRVLATPFYATRSDLEQIWNDSLALLSSHRLNYSPERSTRSVNLWSEWPHEHWEDLRTGVSMNFMVTPRMGKMSSAIGFSMS
jgi:hypothetical protein